MPPRFVSPGAMARNEMEAFLLRQAEDERREAALVFEQQRRADELAFRAEQERRVAAAQAEQQANLEKERRFRRAGTIAGSALPGDVIDDPTAALLREEGYGSQVTQGRPTQGPLLGEDEAGVPQYQVTPGVLQMRGGASFLNAEAQRQAALDRQREADAARAERQAQADATDRAIADVRANQAAAAQAAGAETRGLRNDLLETQIGAAREKQEQGRQTAERARAAAKQTAGATLDTLNELATFSPDGKVTLKPGVGQLFGARMPGITMLPGTRFADAAAALQKLKGRVVVDLIGEMKSQSRTGATGFGALSERELGILEAAATKLSSANISDQAAAEELGRIYAVAQRALAGGTTPAAADPLGIR